MGYKKIAIGADHGGFRLKEDIKKVLTKKGYRIFDVGTESEESCDYPIYGFHAAEMVSGKKVSLGIAICKTGIGMSIIANKLPGVRAALCHTVQDAVSSREHNDANVLVIGASRHTSKEALKMTLAWVEAKHLGGRHARRVRQMKELEKKVFKRTN